ncbi:MAG: hydrogenase expression/formation protein HypE [Gemmataceae bacterium]
MKPSGPEHANSLDCPLPLGPGDRLLLAHGEGARLSRKLIRDLMLQAFDNPYLRPLSDGSLLPPLAESLVLTTDSYVVSPLLFPGGDIGKLAVHGTVNDLAVCGAEALYLSVGMILEEGLPLETLRRVVKSMAEAARKCGVSVVTGDTKVVPKGAADGMFINTTGLGKLRPDCDLGPHRVQVGDRILVSGTLADHGMTILACREGLEFEGDLHSDTASLQDLAADLLAQVPGLRFLRDPTRGGVAAVCHELAEAAEISIQLEEKTLRVRSPTRAACELLGIDPLFVANEGKLLAVVAAEQVEDALKVLRRHSLGTESVCIGTILPREIVPVQVLNSLGRLRSLDEPSGAPLPRIC